MFYRESIERKRIRSALINHNCRINILDKYTDTLHKEISRLRKEIKELKGITKCK